MARLIIMWTRPAGLSTDEARDWACAEVSGLVRAAPVLDAQLTRVGAASDRHPAECGWMLELHLPDGPTAHAFVDEPGPSGWLSDLPQLGLSPRVLLVGTAIRRRENRGR